MTWSVVIAIGNLAAWRYLALLSEEIAHSVRKLGTRQQSDVATTLGVPIKVALVVAAPLRWGVSAAKPPHIAIKDGPRDNPRQSIPVP